MNQLDFIVKFKHFIHDQAFSVDAQKLIHLHKNLPAKTKRAFTNPG